MESQAQVSVSTKSPRALGAWSKFEAIIEGIDNSCFRNSASLSHHINV